MDKLGNKIVYHAIKIAKSPFSTFKPKKDLTYEEIEKEVLPSDPEYLSS